MKSELELDIRYYETDQMGIVHHSNYIRFFECGRSDMMQKAGLPIEKIEKAGVISVGEIREQIVNTMDVMPYKGPYKIYIVDEAEKMNLAAQNAILKTIEEPPEYGIILLLTTNRGAFLPTILSRCILLSVKPVEDTIVQKYLTKELHVPEKTAQFCAGFAMGNLGKAMDAALSEEFLELRQFSVSVLQYIHEAQPYELVEKVKGLNQGSELA